MVFKIGDLVEVTTNGHPDYEKGDKFTIESLLGDSVVRDKKGNCVYTHRLKLAENDNDLSELKDMVSALQSRLEQLGKMCHNEFDKPDNKTLTYEDYKNLVREAKGFVKVNLADAYFVDGYYFVVDLKVNKDKETVVALAKKVGFDSKVIKRGIAKCMKDDVFQEDIGKAIALGRLLGRDVSRFTNI